MQIRKIRAKDNEQTSGLIKKVLLEFGVPKTGSAYADSSLDDMFSAYSQPGSVYFVVEEKGVIIGGSGISQLDNYNGNVYELQKMYFLEEARGKGLGSKLIKLCLKSASDFGYEKCYLETVPLMKTAQKMYLKNGFKYLDGPMGDTGHNACPVWMIKDLSE